MKDSDEVSINDFKTFLNNTLNVNLKKREEHALFVLCDINKNNTVNKEEFLALVNKGERLLEIPPVPLKNNFLEPESFKEDKEKVTKGKSKVTRADSLLTYSGNVKQELVKIIHASNMVSIEEFLRAK